MLNNTELLLIIYDLYQVLFIFLQTKVASSGCPVPRDTLLLLILTSKHKLVICI